MTERFIPCLMVPTKACIEGCPNREKAEGFRDRLEAAIREKLGVEPSEETVLAELAKMDPLTPVIAAPTEVKNSCPQSPVRVVVLRPLLGEEEWLDLGKI